MINVVKQVVEKGEDMERKDDERLSVHSFCPGKIQIPTEREQIALNALREIKMRVRHIKGIMSGLNGEESLDKRGELEQELRKLKNEWDKWEKERKAAAKERMILLGHEKND